MTTTTRRNMTRRAIERQFIEALERLEAVSDRGMPMLPAIPREDGHGWKVWCRYCRCWHHHGIGLGHRTAHCLTYDRRGRAINSAYSSFSTPPGNGYVLVLRDEVLGPQQKAMAQRLLQQEKAEEAKSGTGA